MSKTNYAKILWFQVNRQTLEEGQNFITLKYTLYLEKDKNELYHTISRIGNADSLSYDTTYLIILKRNHRLTELLVSDTSNHIKHLAEQKTLAEIRFCYWVPRSKSFVNPHLRGEGVILPSCWFSFNNSEMVKAVILTFCSIQ